MPYRLSLKNAAHSGTTFRVDGKGKLDRYIFQRAKGIHGEHELIIPDAQWPAVRNDIIFEGQRAVIFVDYILDPSAADAAIVGPLQARIKELEDQVIARGLEKHSAIEALEKARVELSEARATGGGLTQDHIDFLRERDDLLAILGPHALEGETPVHAMTRLVALLTEEDLSPEGGQRSDDPNPAEKKPDPVTPPPQPPPEGPKLYTAHLLQKKKVEQLQSIAGELGIEAPHEIKPAAKLITAIMEKQAALQQAA